MAKIPLNLTRLRADQITFSQFYIATIDEWTALAGRLITRWQPPASIDAEDLVQEMFAVVPTLIESWDPTRGTLHRYVTYSAVHVAKRVLHRQRGVSLHGCPDRAKSRVPISISMLPGMANADGDVTPWTPEAIAEPTPPNQRVVDGVIDAMRLVNTRRERSIMEALIVAGTVGGAAFGGVTYSTGTYDAAAKSLVAEGWPHHNTRAAVARTARTFARRAAMVIG